MKMYLIVADTNFLLSPFQFNYNLDHELRRIFGSYKILVPKSVVNELKSIAGMGGKDGKIAKSVLEMISREDFEVIDLGIKRADDEVLEIAKKFSGILATNDKILKERAIKEGIPCLYMKKKGFLFLEDPKGEILRSWAKIPKIFPSFSSIRQYPNLSNCTTSPTCSFTSSSAIPS